MNDAIQATVHIDDQNSDRADSSHSGFPTDREMSRTAAIAGLPARTIGPEFCRLIHERRQRNAAMDVAREIFEQAYVCAFLSIEVFTAQPLDNEDGMARCIDLIEEARRVRADSWQLDAQDDLSVAYARPTINQVRGWLTRHSRSQIVTNHLLPLRAIEQIRSREHLVYAIAGSIVWRHWRSAYERAVAECVRSTDPSIDLSSSDLTLWRAIKRVNSEYRLVAHFTPSLIREWL